MNATPPLTANMPSVLAIISLNLDYIEYLSETDTLSQSSIQVLLWPLIRLWEDELDHDNMCMLTEAMQTMSDLQIIRLNRLFSNPDPDMY